MTDSFILTEEELQEPIVNDPRVMTDEELREFLAREGCYSPEWYRETEEG